MASHQANINIDGVMVMSHVHAARLHAVGADAR